jgi:hypothetical protein
MAGLVTWLPLAVPAARGGGGGSASSMQPAWWALALPGKVMPAVPALLRRRNRDYGGGGGGAGASRQLLAQPQCAATVRRVAGASHLRLAAPQALLTQEVAAVVAASQALISLVIRLPASGAGRWRR